MNIVNYFNIWAIDIVHKINRKCAGIHKKTTIIISYNTEFLIFGENVYYITLKNFSSVSVSLTCILRMILHHLSGCHYLKHILVAFPIYENHRKSIDSFWCFYLWIVSLAFFCPPITFVFNFYSFHIFLQSHK